MGPSSLLEEARHLTGDEWVKAQGIFHRNDLTCELQTTGWGFYVGMSVSWGHPPVQLDRLIFITAKHLPEDLIPVGAGRHFTAGWAAFSPLRTLKRTQPVSWGLGDPSLVSRATTPTRSPHVAFD